MEMKAFPGGYNMEVYNGLSEFVWKHKPNEIGVEQNHGYGALAQNWRPVLLDYYKEKTGEAHSPKIIDDWVSTQKELRIIDTLEPMLGRHRIVINEDVFTYDANSVQQYPIDQRQTYLLVHQINKLTRDHGALIHDDRIDSFAGGARRFVSRLAVDESLRVQQKMSSENMRLMAEWSDEFKQTTTGGLGNILQRRGSVTNRQIRRRKR